VSNLRTRVSRDFCRVRESPYGSYLGAEPGLHAEMIQLFYREEAAYDARRAFEYVFIGEAGPAFETPNHISFRVCEPEERFLALVAFDRERRDLPGHIGEAVCPLPRNQITSS
jgi:hypothetical protein